MSEEKNSISLKELATKLKISDALLKKLIKDFSIDTLKVKNRMHLAATETQTVREIMALRASGKKNSEIKEMFLASKKAQEPSEEKVEKTKEVEAKKSKTEKPEKQELEQESEKSAEKKTLKKKKKKKSEEEADTKEEPKDKKEKASATNKKSNKKTKSKNKDSEAKKKSSSQEEAQDEDDDSILNINEYMDQTETDNDFKSRLAYDEEDDEEGLESVAEDEEDFDEEEDDDEPETSSKKSGKFRRRQFSYKYIQRQIMNDQKRIKYIQQKLQRGRISTKEKMQLQESLEIRDKLLSGWVKLLRWVKS